MEQFTILDVIRYERYRIHETSVPCTLLKTFINLIYAKTQDEDAKRSFKYLGEWIELSYNGKKQLNIDDLRSTLSNIKITEGKWTKDEVDWFHKKYYDSIINNPFKFSILCCCAYKRILDKPNEIFWIFCEILRQKFGYDENMMIIMDDCLKRYII